MRGRGLARGWSRIARALAALMMVAVVAAAGAWWLAAPALLAAAAAAFLPELVRGWRTVGRFGAAERAAREARRQLAGAPPGARTTELAWRAYRDAHSAEDDDLARLAGMRQAAQLARAAQREPV